jgi:hypothetical protein
MTAESSEDFHAHVEFYRKFVRHGAQFVAVVAVVLALMALFLT